jgi:hypothetical protein
MNEAEKQIIDLLRGIRTEVLDLKVRLYELERHMQRQDAQVAESIEASRRLMTAIDALDDSELPH